MRSRPLSVETTHNTGEQKASIGDALALELQAIVASQSCTKRTAVRLVISNCIQSGVLRPGDYLPSEKVLAEILNVSLGTVQVALGQLQDLGLLQRRRGDGTRVSAMVPPTAPWGHEAGGGAGGCLGPQVLLQPTALSF